MKKLFPFLISLTMALASIETHAVAPICLNWIALLPGTLSPIYEDNTKPVFTANFLRLKEVSYSDTKPSTIVVPAMTRTGKSSVINALAKDWRDKGGVPLIVDFQRDPSGDRPLRLLQAVLEDADIPREQAKL